MPPWRRARARRILREGFVVGVTNPKVIVFFAAILPQFVDYDRGHPAVQMLVLGLVFVAIALVSDSMWGLAAGTARVWLGRSPRRLAAIGGTSGVVMIGLGRRASPSPAARTERGWPCAALRRRARAIARRSRLGASRSASGGGAKHGLRPRS